MHSTRGFLCAWGAMFARLGEIDAGRAAAEWETCNFFNMSRTLSIGNVGPRAVNLALGPIYLAVFPILESWMDASSLTAKKVLVFFAFARVSSDAFRRRRKRANPFLDE